MSVEIILIGVTVICGLGVLIYRRHNPYDDGGIDDYGYRVPRTGMGYAGHESVEETTEDAEGMVEWSLGEDWPRTGG